MADTPPAAVDEGQKPAVDEGQKPVEGDAKPDAEAKGKTYSEAYVKQLRAEAAENRKKLADAEERLQEQEDAEKSELEKAKAEAAREKERADKEALERNRLEVVAAAGLPSDAAKFLTGATREEMELHAEELGKLMQETKGQRPAAGFDGGARRTAPEDVPPEKAHNDFLLRALGREPSRRS